MLNEEVDVDMFVEAPAAPGNVHHQQCANSPKDLLETGQRSVLKSVTSVQARTAGTNNKERSQKRLREGAGERERERERETAGRMWSGYRALLQAMQSKLQIDDGDTLMSGRRTMPAPEDSRSLRPPCHFISSIAIA